ncbi:sulfatase-like hydrolase/transferase [Bosea sp. AS-1]|jgi:arylsulfatase A-like enzyme|uniref:sulfatase family protein n=1 Tax=Bosea sp. AS-1 TaxID=2015316 RepID=UPI000B799DFF|nr:sulfatase-like hydrolase/transferase [Bosea sp. AS-1]
MRRPNILLFMPDQLRGDWAGPRNAGRVPTPELDRVVARGVRFLRAVCPSPICGPSRACLASGYEYDRAGVRNNGDSASPDAPNVYRQLRDAGYHVMTCGKLDMLKGEPDWGEDGQHALQGPSRLKRLGFTGGLDSAGKHAAIFAHRDGHPEPYFVHLKQSGLAGTHWSDFAGRTSPALGPDALDFPGAGANYRNITPTALPDEAYCDNWIGACALSLIEEGACSGKPWFLQVNLTGPHEPMDVTASMASGAARLDPPAPVAPADDMAPEAHRAIRRNYAAMIANIDAIFGRLLARIEALGQAQDTVVVFTSDHGEMLGDCGYWEKFIPHQASLHVPLVIAGPGVAQGATVDGPTTLLDLHATFVELAGAQPLPGIDSRSLVHQLAEPARRHRDVVHAGLGSWRAIYDGRFKYVAGFDPLLPRKLMEAAAFTAEPDENWRLVEPEVDPVEATDLSARHPAIAARLRALLAANASARGGWR